MTMTIIRLLARWLLRRKHSNCLVYAFCRLIIEGGEVRIVRSPRPGSLMRASWTQDGQTLYSWRSKHARNWSKARTMVNQIWFEGYPKEVKR